MGMGDELMAMGEAWQVSQDYGSHPICILDRTGRRRFHPIWEGAPYIRQPADLRGGIGVRNGPGCRPYIRAHDAERFHWLPYRPVPANLDHIVATTGTINPGDIIVIEPRLKPNATTNKQWPAASWADVINQLPLITSLRPVVLGAAPYEGVAFISTPTFRDLVATMRAAALYIGHEGGLHHLAAALGIPSVVIFGGYVGPIHTGYDTHYNLTGTATPCGMRTPCEHCREAMRAIKPDHVLDAAQAALTHGPKATRGEQ